MNTRRLPSEKLYEIIAYLAKQQGVTIAEFEKKISSEMQKNAEQEKLFADIIEMALELPEALKNKLTQQLVKKSEKTEFRKDDSEPRPLSELKNLGQDELAGRKPLALIINGKSSSVKDWTEATQVFIKQLLENGDLRDSDLPLIVSERGKKAYLNSTSVQLGNKDAVFKKVREGIYVDTKYNSLGHVKNMFSTLKKLGVIEKYSIDFKF